MGLRKLGMWIATPKSQWEYLESNRHGSVPELPKTIEQARAWQFNALKRKKNVQELPQPAPTGNPFQRAVNKRQNYQMGRAESVHASIEKANPPPAPPRAFPGSDNQPQYLTQVTNGILAAAAVERQGLFKEAANPGRANRLLAESSFITGLLSHLTGKYTEGDLTDYEKRNGRRDLKQIFSKTALETFGGLSASFNNLSAEENEDDSIEKRVEKDRFKEMFPKSPTDARKALEDKIEVGGPIGPDPKDPRMKFLMMLIENEHPSYPRVNVRIYEPDLNGRMEPIYDTHNDPKQPKPSDLPTVCMVRVILKCDPHDDQVYFDPLVAKEADSNPALQRFRIVQQKTGWGLVESFFADLKNPVRRKLRRESLTYLEEKNNRLPARREDFTNRRQTTIRNEFEKRTDQNYPWENLKKEERARLRERAGFCEPANLKVPVPDAPAILTTAAEGTVRQQIAMLQRKVNALPVQPDAARNTKRELKELVGNMNEEFDPAVANRDTDALQRVRQFCQLALAKTNPEPLPAPPPAPVPPPVGDPIAEIRSRLERIKTALNEDVQPNANLTPQEMERRLKHEMIVLKECGIDANGINDYETALRAQEARNTANNGAHEALNQDLGEHAEAINRAIGGDSRLLNDKVRQLSILTGNRAQCAVRHLEYEFQQWKMKAINHKYHGLNGDPPRLNEELSDWLAVEDRGDELETAKSTINLVVRGSMSDDASTLQRDCQDAAYILERDPERLAHVSRNRTIEFLKAAPERIAKIRKAIAVDVALNEISRYITEDMSTTPYLNEERVNEKARHAMLSVFKKLKAAMTS